jgi:hypothetical protein
VNRRAALFDMDRTLVRVDTATLYVRYQREKGDATFRDVTRVAWWMLQYTLGVIDARARSGSPTTCSPMWRRKAEKQSKGTGKTAISSPW